MSQTRTLIVTFAGAGSQDLPGGTFLFIKTASAALDVIITDQNGTQSTLSQIGAGARLRRPQTAPWRFTKLTSAAAQVVTVIISDEAEFDVANTVTVSGSVQTVETPSTAIADTAPKTTVAVTQAALVPANLSRKRVTFFSRPDNAGDSFIFFRIAGGVNDIGCIQPGQTIEFCTTAGIDYRAVAGGDIIQICEET